MGEDTIIVPTILTDDTNVFVEQMKAYISFAKRIQIDLMDGTFTPNRSVPESSISQLPNGIQFDFHIMAIRPSDHLSEVLRLHPHLAIFHAEASEDLLPIFDQLKKAGIRAGVAILPTTYPGLIKKYLEVADHALIFAGNLGQQGAKADILQAEKVKIIRSIKPDIEIGWDGGANLTNVRALANYEVNVINVGSALSQPEDKKAAYAALVAEAKKRGVFL